MTPELDIEQLWTVSDVCRMLGVKKTWVYTQAQRGELPCVRLSGQCVRFIPADVKKWVESKRARTATVVAFPGGLR